MHSAEKGDHSPLSAGERFTKGAGKVFGAFKKAAALATTVTRRRSEVSVDVKEPNQVETV
jgi:hypothetical protein